jgi:hypothetical protein
LELTGLHARGGVRTDKESDTCAFSEHSEKCEDPLKIPEISLNPEFHRNILNGENTHHSEGEKNSAFYVTLSKKKLHPSGDGAARFAMSARRYRSRHIT